MEIWIGGRIRRLLEKDRRPVASLRAHRSARCDGSQPSPQTFRIPDLSGVGLGEQKHLLGDVLRVRTCPESSTKSDQVGEVAQVVPVEQLARRQTNQRALHTNECPRGEADV